MDNETDTRKLLLDFYSSELQTHSSLIIGLAVVLFTVVQIQLSLAHGFPLTDPSWLFVTMLWGLSGSLWYFLLRHFAYGILCNSVMECRINKSEISPYEFAALVRNKAYLSNILIFFPSALFIRGGNIKVPIWKNAIKVDSKWAMRLGFVICYVVLGSFTTSALLFLIGVPF